METWEGKSFSITDPKGVSTVIYQILKTPKALLKEYPKYALERLDSTEEIRGDAIRKTFYVDFPSIDQDELVILSFGKDNFFVTFPMRRILVIAILLKRIYQFFFCVCFIFTITNLGKNLYCCNKTR